MYDVEMMEMLNLIHLENQQIFELVRASILSEEINQLVCTLEENWKTAIA